MKATRARTAAASWGVAGWPAATRPPAWWVCYLETGEFNGNVSAITRFIPCKITLRRFLISLLQFPYEHYFLSPCHSTDLCSCSFHPVLPLSLAFCHSPSELSPSRTSTHMEARNLATLELIIPIGFPMLMKCMPQVDICFYLVVELFLVKVHLDP
jgi:hypothetical protein